MEFPTSKLRGKILFFTNCKSVTWPYSVIIVQRIWVSSLHYFNIHISFHTEVLMCLSLGARRQRHVGLTFTEHLLSSGHSAWISTYSFFKWGSEMLSKLYKFTQPKNDKTEMKTWSIKPMFFALWHSHCLAQWNTMMEHMLAKFHHGSVLSVFTPEVRKAICLKDNLPFIYVPGWWDEREVAMVLPTRLKVPGVLLLGKAHLPDVWIKVSGWVYPKSPVSKFIWDESQPSK